MRKLIIITVLMLSAIAFAHAQSKQERDRQDSILMANVFDPFVQDAADNNVVPDWNVLKTKVSAGHDAAFTERFVWKAKIYYYYGKDWPAFTAVLVHHTDTYEDHSDLKLMNKNAKMVLKYSSDPGALKDALSWSKLTVTGDPDNADYKSTYDGLTAKISGK